LKRYSKTTTRVRYKDTDQMGVVYYANYFVWFELGRSEYFRELGMSYKDLEQNELFLPVVEAYCKYHYPARYDDELSIITTLSMMQEVKLGFRYDIINIKDDKALASGETIHAFVNEKGKPVVLRKQNPFLWRLLKEKVMEKVEP
jgi:acyl-CoA thioester hydrolase